MFTLQSEIVFLFSFLSKHLYKSWDRQLVKNSGNPAPRFTRRLFRSSRWNGFCRIGDPGGDSLTINPFILLIRNLFQKLGLHTWDVMTRPTLTVKSQESRFERKRESQQLFDENPFISDKNWRIISGSVCFSVNPELNNLPAPVFTDSL